MLKLGKPLQRLCTRNNFLKFLTVHPLDSVIVRNIPNLSRRGSKDAVFSTGITLLKNIPRQFFRKLKNPDDKIGFVFVDFRLLQRKIRPTLGLSNSAHNGFAPFSIETFSVYELKNPVFY